MTIQKLENRNKVNKIKNPFQNDNNKKSQITKHNIEIYTTASTRLNKNKKQIPRNRSNNEDLENAEKNQKIIKVKFRSRGEQRQCYQ